MENFLLTVIIVLLLAIYVIVKILQLIFRFIPTYQAPMVNGMDRGGLNGRGGGSFFLILLVLGLGFYLFTKQESQAQDQPLPPRPITEQKETNDDSLNLFQEDSGKNRVTPKREEEPERIIRVNNPDTPESTPFRVYHYNEPPHHVTLPDVFFGIQLEAFDEEVNVAEYLGTLDPDFIQDLWVVYIPGEAPFKVILGPFDNWSNSEDYRVENKIKGFTKRVNLGSE